MIIGHGSSNPLAFFVADAGYGEDLRSQYALTGYSESILREMLKSTGFSLEEFYRTCLIKEEIPYKGNNKQDEKQGKLTNLEKVKGYLPLLINEINDLKPNLLIPLGELSFQALTGLYIIRKFRGSCLPASRELNLSQPTKVLPILGPYPYLIQEYNLRYITRIDFTKIPKHINNLPPPDNFTNIQVLYTGSSLRDFLNTHYTEDGTLAFDIETYFGIPTCISFCFDGVNSACVALLDRRVSIEHRVIMIELIAKLLASPIKKINQNIKYDWKIMERWGFQVNNVVGDTMLAASCLYCEFPKNLGFLTSIYTDLPYFKDEGKDTDPNKNQKEQYYRYNAKDSLAAWQIHKIQLEEIKEQGVEWVYSKLIELMPIYKRMEDRGILIDMKEREALLEKYRDLYSAYCKKLGFLAELEYINPLSPVQMNTLVFKTLEFKPIKGVKGTDEDSIELLIAFGNAKRAPTTGKKILETIRDCRKLHKVIELLEAELYPDGRFRCEFNLAGTENGRTSAGKTTDRILRIEKKKITKYKLGHSLQTIGKHGFSIDGLTYGKDLRKMFVASPGYTFVECDLSGAEARVDRVLSGKFDMEVFEDPGIHKLTGSWIYECPPEAINKKDLIKTSTGKTVNRYYVAKQVRHAGERNITPAGLITKLLQGFTLKEGTQLLNIFHENEPEIKKTFHNEVINHVDNCHKLIAPNGRRRDFFDRLCNHTYNEAISFLPQAIVSDQTKFHGILPTANRMPEAHFLTEQHDGILAEVPTARVREFVEIYKECVEDAIDFRFGSLKRDYALSIPCEASVGQNWYDMEDFAI